MMLSARIGSVDTKDEVLVIAEIGNNHEGDLGRAEEMIGRAAEAGAQAVKFQSIKPEALVKADQTARIAQLKKFELSNEDHVHLSSVAAQAGVMFISSPFSLPAVKMLEPLVPAFKIASGDNDFVPLINRVAETRLPIICSTGMTDLAGVSFAKSMIERTWARDGHNGTLVLLHCVSAYPTPPENANLRAIEQLSKLGCPVGYSDHTLGISAAVLSVAFGAQVIEKHFTLSKTTSDFRDHQLSAEPHELRELVLRVREARELMGNGIKRVMDVETQTALAARRSIGVAADLPADHIISMDDLAWLRPSGGLRPGDEAMVLGRTTRHAISAGSHLSMQDIT